MQVEQAYFKPLIYILAGGGIQDVCVFEWGGWGVGFLYKFWVLVVFRDNKIIIIFICKKGGGNERYKAKYQALLR